MKNEFSVENIQFFNPTYFPIFQHDGPNNLKKSTFNFTRGFLGQEKLIIGGKYSSFQPKIFSDFPRWQTEKLKKMSFKLYKGVFRARKINFRWKIFDF